MTESLESRAEAERGRQKPVQIRCCQSAGCLSAGGHAVWSCVQDAAAQQRDIEVLQVGCLGLCSQAPLVSTARAGETRLFGHVKPDQAAAVLAASQGEPAADLQEVDTSGPFFALQHRIVLANCGRVEPERIESYLALGGYRALRKALFEMTPAEVVQTISGSGLRGRGGAGYPTGLKWSLLAKAPAGPRYVICNGDEGDPGAFMDRSILESDPHRVLEGMAIAAYAVGAHEGYLYIRGEYPLAVQRMQIALQQARQLGVLGSGILDSRFDLRLHVRVGPGAYVCGEETALIASIEGRRGSPRPRPPYPPERGLWDRPTLINNVETFANVAEIVARGADWYASMGTEKSKGTKVFALTGKIRRSGLVEVKMGTPLRTIVESIGGGCPGGAVKAVQTGGPSGGCVPAVLLDTPVDYEALTRLGSMMGSGGMVVLDEHDRMLDIARFFMQFCRDESCGKCVPCRVGTTQMHRILERMCDGEARPSDRAQLQQLCEMVGATSLCGLGQNAPNPVLSILRHFPEEFEDGGPHGGTHARD